MSSIEPKISLHKKQTIYSRAKLKISEKNLLCSINMTVVYMPIKIYSAKNKFSKLKITINLANQK